MEHPVAGQPFLGASRPREIRKNKALQHGGTSLKLSEGDSSPVLEAHPGSPVDLNERPRPSLAASLSQRLYHGSDAELAKFERKKLAGKNEEAIRRDGVAAKGYCPVINRAGSSEGDCSIPPNKLMQVASGQPFFIPAKISEQDEVHPGALVDTSIDGEQKRLSVDTEMAMEFDFKTENGIWISANPLARESRSSLATTATTTTAMTSSTLVDDRMSHGALTVDTSVASSAASMMSSVGSIQSAISTASADMYGWEEELERKESIETNMAWEREIGRRLPSGGRTPGPRMRGGVHEYNYKRTGGDGKRKSLLYRVLNLSGSRRGSADEGIPPLPGTTSPGNAFSNTSA
jgi:hypothetical protein